MALVFPDWPAPSNVKAFYTTRMGGDSRAPFDAFNLGAHVGDTKQAVELNRRRLAHALARESSVRGADKALRIGWLNQIHGTYVAGIAASSQVQLEPTDADASHTLLPGHVCAVMTADCLPVLFCDRNGTQVAAAHAGWRGLAAGILSNVVATFGAKPSDILCYLGPAIGPRSFQVGSDVRQAFIVEQQSRAYAERVEHSFKIDTTTPDGIEQKYLADLYRLARSELEGLGITDIYGGNRCTFNEASDFYSYRRDHITGRMATGIWLES